MLQVLLSHSILSLLSADLPYDRHRIGNLDIIRLDVHGVALAAHHFIAAYFRGSGRLELPNRPDGYYEARVVNQIAFAKILRGNTPRTFSVSFRCKPFLHLYSGEAEQVITSGSFLLNPTGIQGKPLISIAGSGDITLLVGMQIIELEGIENGIILDSELQEAYWDGVLKNSCMTGEFPVLGEGNTAISWTGGTVTRVTIIPRWVSL